jgi:hypothetical protein
VKQARRARGMIKKWSYEKVKRDFWRSPKFLGVKTATMVTLPFPG